MEEKFKNLLQESEIRYRRLFESARDGILILRYETGQIDDVNPFLEELLGYKKKEIIAKKLWELGVFKNSQLSQDYFKILQKNGYVRYENLPLVASDGRHIEVEFVSNVYKVGKAKVIQCNIRDVSEKRRLEIGIESERQLDIEKAKGEFIADATHEFRTPLAIIKGNVDLALRSKKNDYKSAIKTLKAIDIEVKHLSSLLSDLTMFTSDNNKYHRRSTDYRQQKVIVLQKIDIISVIKSAVERCKTLAGKKNITIKILSTFPNVKLMGDKSYLEKLFVNIINNAITYGKENGKITILGEKSANAIKVKISDNGIGINAEDLPRIFDRFYRAENGRVGNSVGTGLGLAISKWIVEAHGGSIVAESLVDKLTVFTVTLPLPIN